jgi:hypothetical protein
MKTKFLILIGSALLSLAGCATPQGGTEEYNPPTTYGQPQAPTHVQGAAPSPNWRPNMNREDPRNAQFNTRAQPTSTPSRNPD